MALSNREAIMRLEAVMLELPDVETKLTHHFAPGIYARELFIPAGTVITGKIHKTEHLNIISQGRIAISNMGETTMVVAPHTMVSKPGTKRAGFVYEDTVWTTIHATTETDIPTLEDMLVTNDFSEVEHLLDQQDYAKFVIEYGITEVILDKLEALPVTISAIEGIEIKDSKRHGLGVFATKTFSADDFIAVAVCDGQNTLAGRYANHSELPNAKMVRKDDKNNDLIAIKDIDIEEITVNYRDVLEDQK